MTRSFQDVINTAGKSLRFCLDWVCGVEHINMEYKRNLAHLHNDAKQQAFVYGSWQQQADRRIQRAAEQNGQPRGWVKEKAL